MTSLRNLVDGLMLLALLMLPQAMVALLILTVQFTG